MEHANWINQAREHWKEHLPRMYARLESKQKLEEALANAATATAAAMRALTLQGLDQQTAWEAVREDYLFRPAEAASEPKGRPSQGYLAHRDLMRGLSNFDPNAAD